MVYTKKGSVNRISKSNEIPEWVKDFAKKIAVQPANTQQNIYQQISNVITNHSINGPQKHTSVQAAVQDMMERSGITAYKQKIAQRIINEANEAVKLAEENKSLESNQLPVIIEKHPYIKSTFENFIQNTKGNLPVLSIIEKVKSIHKNDVNNAHAWDEEKLYKYVYDLNKQNKIKDETNYGNLGYNRTDDDIDPANYDAFHSLMPAKI
jgi:hypothetical protein